MALAGMCDGHVCGRLAGHPLVHVRDEVGLEMTRQLRTQHVAGATSVG